MLLNPSVLQFVLICHNSTDNTVVNLKADNLETNDMETKSKRDIISNQSIYSWCLCMIGMSNELQWTRLIKTYDVIALRYHNSSTF